MKQEVEEVESPTTIESLVPEQSMKETTTRKSEELESKIISEKVEETTERQEDSEENVTSKFIEVPEETTSIPSEPSAIFVVTPSISAKDSTGAAEVRIADETTTTLPEEELQNLFGVESKTNAVEEKSLLEDETTTESGKIPSEDQFQEVDEKTFLENETTTESEEVPSETVSVGESLQVVEERILPEDETTTESEQVHSNKETVGEPLQEVEERISPQEETTTEFEQVQSDSDSVGELLQKVEEKILPIEETTTEFVQVPSGTETDEIQFQEAEQRTIPNEETSTEFAQVSIATKTGEEQLHDDEVRTLPDTEATTEFVQVPSDMATVEESLQEVEEKILPEEETTTENIQVPGDAGTVKEPLQEDEERVLPEEETTTKPKHVISGAEPIEEPPQEVEEIISPQEETTIESLQTSSDDETIKEPLHKVEEKISINEETTTEKQVPSNIERGEEPLQVVEDHSQQETTTESVLVKSDIETDGEQFQEAEERTLPDEEATTESVEAPSVSVTDDDQFEKVEENYSLEQETTTEAIPVPSDKVIGGVQPQESEERLLPDITTESVVIQGREEIVHEEITTEKAPEVDIQEDTSTVRVDFLEKEERQEVTEQATNHVFIETTQRPSEDELLVTATIPKEIIEELTTEQSYEVPEIQAEDETAVKVSEEEPVMPDFEQLPLSRTETKSMLDEERTTSEPFTEETTHPSNEEFGAKPKEVISEDTTQFIAKTKEEEETTTVVAEVMITSTMKSSSEVVSISKGIESRLLNETSDDVTTIQPVAASSADVGTSSGGQVEEEASVSTPFPEETTHFRAAEGEILVEDQLHEEPLTTMTTTEEEEMTSTIGTSSSAVAFEGEVEPDTEEEETIESGSKTETNEIEHSETSTTSVYNEGTSFTLNETTQTTGRTTSAEPKRISIHDIIIGSSTTESMEFTTTTEEAATIEQMYPMILGQDEEATDRPEAEPRTEMPTVDVNITDTSTASVVIKLPELLNGSVIQILEDVEATTVFDVVISPKSKEADKAEVTLEPEAGRILPEEEEEATTVFDTVVKFITTTFSSIGQESDVTTSKPLLVEEEFQLKDNETITDVYTEVEATTQYEQLPLEVESRTEQEVTEEEQVTETGEAVTLKIESRTEGEPVVTDLPQIVSDTTVKEAEGNESDLKLVTSETVTERMEGSTPDTEPSVEADEASSEPPLTLEMISEETTMTEQPVEDKTEGTTIGTKLKTGEILIPDEDTTMPVHEDREQTTTVSVEMMEIEATTAKVEGREQVTTSKAPEQITTMESDEKVIADGEESVGTEEVPVTTQEAQVEGSTEGEGETMTDSSVKKQKIEIAPTIKEETEVQVQEETTFRKSETEMTTSSPQVKESTLRTEARTKEDEESVTLIPVEESTPIEIETRNEMQPVVPTPVEEVEARTEAEDAIYSTTEEEETTTPVVQVRPEMEPAVLTPVGEVEARTEKEEETITLKSVEESSTSEVETKKEMEPEVIIPVEEVEARTEPEDLLTPESEGMETTPVEGVEPVTEMALTVEEKTDVPESRTETAEEKLASIPESRTEFEKETATARGFLEDTTLETERKETTPVVELTTEAKTEIFTQLSEKKTGEETFEEITDAPPELEQTTEQPLVTGEETEATKELDIEPKSEEVSPITGTESSAEEQKPPLILSVVESTTLMEVQIGEESSSVTPEIEPKTLPEDSSVTETPVLDLTTTKLVLVEELEETTLTPDVETETTTVTFGVEEEEDQSKFDLVPEARVEPQRNETLHTLKCHLTSNIESDPGTAPMECKEEATSIEPIIVVISLNGLDLESISRRNIKIVVKDFMLMEMKQNQAPKRRK